ncbi:Regulatory protein AsnC [archaeon HR01]|nr:Regulatory protein AsnC [archaeon HR01]
MELDDLDRRILNLLYEDGRMSYAEIGRRLQASENTIRMRVEKLVKKGVIRRFAALVDPRAVGLNNSAAVMLRIDPERLENVLKELADMREVYNIYQLSGDYDAIAVIMCRDLQHLQNVVLDIKKLKGVNDVNTLITLKVVKAELRYALQ